LKVIKIKIKLSTQKPLIKISWTLMLLPPHLPGCGDGDKILLGMKYLAATAETKKGP
jgi:hypothetical protein